MKKITMALFFLLVVLFGISVFANSTSSLGNYKQAVVKANNQFAIDLYNHINGNGNVFFSPFSIFDALSMTYAGARNETEEQMAKVLHITLPQERFHRAFSKIIEEIKSSVQKNKYTLKIANALWGQKGFHFLNSFLSLVKNCYDGNVFSVNFYNGMETAQKINYWVDNQTNDKIKRIIGKINPLTRLILTNAVYFKGEWSSGFATATTEPSTFYVNPKQEVKVSMMYQEGKFSYMENSALQALEMPYKGGNLSMVVLLPKNKYGIDEVEKALSVSNLKQWFSGMREQKVKVHFPKFGLKTSYDLKNTLTSMGMSNAFSNADFSGMDGEKDLCISKVLQKAYVEVNEKGTEAAAVTAVVTVLTCSPNYHPPEVPIFRADHPFVFFIIDKPTGVILFMGKITKIVKN